jgi:hypothetical protein
MADAVSGRPMRFGIVGEQPFGAGTHGRIVVC